MIMMMMMKNMKIRPRDRYQSDLPLVLWSMYSRMILTSCTRVRIKAPNAKEPTWYLKCTK